MLAKALGPGERWITVHPNGPDAKGQPVLIQPQPDGSAKVIGGAGGKLNHLRLTGIKPQSEYADTLRQRAVERRERAAGQKARDKELGLTKKKADAHERITAKLTESNQAFVNDVAAAMGWDPAEYKFDPKQVEGKPDHVIAQIQRAHLMDMVRKAQAAVNVNRDRLLHDASQRAEVDIGEIPITSDDANTLSVQDIDPVRGTPLGVGFSTGYKERAEDAGGTEADMSAEAASFKPDMTDAQRKAAIKNGETAAMVREGLEALRESDDVAKLQPKLVEAKETLELMKLEKRRKLIERQARDARRQINETTEEPKAFIVEVDDATVDEKVAAEVTNDLRTISTRAFLSAVNAEIPDAASKLGRHVGVGAFNSVNALALAAGGDALVDRSVVDVLGIAGAAEVLARRLHTDLTPDEMKDVTDGFEDFHLNHYMEASEEAIGRARELKDEAKEIELGAAENGSDLAALQEINHRRAEAINESQKVLGTALGEMEANAALVYALQRGKSEKPFEVALGRTSVESAITQLRAIGLQRGDYTLEKADGNQILKVLPEGMDRLAKPVNRADLEQVRRNLDIIQGKHDEDGWLPKGVSDRPDLGMDLKPGVAPQLAEPYTPGPDAESSLRDYIGGRAADGDSPASILSDIQSADFIKKTGATPEAYHAALEKLAPLAGANGKLQQAEALRSAFDGMADHFVGSRGVEPFHRQNFEVDHAAIDALHRALSAEPTGVAAYKPIGELTPQDQGALRDYFGKHVAKESKEAAALRAEHEAHAGAEPERETEDMFGDRSTNPEWTAWNQHKTELGERLNAGSLTWPKYVQSMRGPERAYAAMQDVVRSGVTKAFADAYNRLNPDKPLKVGRSAIRENLNHLDAVDPKARDARLAKERALVDRLRERTAGRYASGAVSDKLDAAREDEAGEAAAQMNLFADAAPARDAPMGADERYSIGHEAERTIASMVPSVGQNFKAGQPVKLGRPQLSGGKNVARQRAIKLIAENKRAVLSFGTGAGKTFIGLGAFAHLRETGKAKRGLFLAPSIAQGGFGADALRYLEPGKFKWNVEPGASREQRIKAYKDPTNDFAVMTHQAFRDDMLFLGAKHARKSEADMSAEIAGMDRDGRADWLKGVMRREGINFDYLNVDEGHDTLNRQGKENSALANVVDALSDRTPYYVTASADPIKNDVSEAFSLLQKMDPARYTDQKAFMRKYGVDTLAAKDGLRRELARFQYPSKIDPDITANRSEVSVPVGADQRRELDEMDQAFSSARLARMKGDVDVEAMKRISPSSFEGAENEEVIARRLADNLGIMKSTAYRRILDGGEGGKGDKVVELAGARRGKQGIVFAHSLDAVAALKARLGREGYRVSTITGADSAKDKAARIAEFRPVSGDSAVDIMVASDAGAVGANLQSGRWLVNYDTPDTAKTHAQRNGRINRVGQTNDVELMDLVSDHPEEKARRDRLTRKYALREALTTPMESLDDSGVAYYLRQRAIARENGGML